MKLAEVDDNVQRSKWADLLDVHHANRALYLSPYIRHAQRKKLLGHIWIHHFGKLPGNRPAHQQPCPMDKQH